MTPTLPFPTLAALPRPGPLGLPQRLLEATAQRFGDGSGPATASDIAANAALLFLVGGLAMLALIVVLVILQSLLPDHSPDDSAPGNARQLRPVGGGPLSSPGLGSPEAVAPTIDHAMDQVVAQGLGEPRLLRVRPDLARVRLYGCSGCAGRPPGGANAPGCFHPNAGLQETFAQVFGGAVRSHEVLCRLRGDPECEFEVKH